VFFEGQISNLCCLHLSVTKQGYVNVTNTTMSPPWRPPAKRTRERNAQGGRSDQFQQLHQSRARPLTAVTAAGPAWPVLDLLVISAPAIGVDSHHYLNFVSEVKPRKTTMKTSMLC